MDNNRIDLETLVDNDQAALAIDCLGQVDIDFLCDLADCFTNTSLPSFTMESVERGYGSRFLEGGGGRKARAAKTYLTWTIQRNLNL